MLMLEYFLRVSTSVWLRRRYCVVGDVLTERPSVWPDCEAKAETSGSASAAS